VAVAGSPTQGAGVLRDHTYHPLRVARVVRETADAASFVLEVPADLAATFAYAAGQFCTFRAEVDGESLVRCYSMSSCPAVDRELQVTVKHVPGGAFSGWMLDALARGDEIDVAPPAGFFQLTADDGALVAFAAGSGITPIYSLVKEALATTARPIRVLYANRDRESVIFGRELDALAAAHPDRLTIDHHLDVERGFLDGSAATAFVAGAATPSAYVCGPTPFMDVVEQALLAEGIAADRIHIERFTPAAPAAAPDTSPTEPAAAAATRVTIELDGRTHAVDHHPGTTILQTARQLGLAAPSSCESGSCATCMARLVQGSAVMRVNNALTPDEVEAGWVLTCQAVPDPPAVHVVYGYD
jgi:ferredoxin-NADP reductase